MKQKIYLLGLISFAIVIIGTLFKMMHYPGAGILLTLGFFALVLLFFPMAMINSYRKEGNKVTKPLYIVSYITLFIMFSAMLFKIMHWPGAGVGLLIALPFPFVVFLPVFLVVTGKMENFNIYKTVTVLLILSIMSVFNALLALNVSKERLDDSMFLASLYHRTALIKKENRLNSVEGAEEVINASDKVLKLIGEAKEKFRIVTLSDNETLINDPYSMRYPDAMSLPVEVMFRGTEPYLGYRLDQGLTEFIEAVAVSGDSRVTRQKAMDLLGFTTEVIEGRTWSEMFFIDDWTSWSLVYLGLLENNVMLLRNEILTDIK